MQGLRGFRRKFSECGATAKHQLYQRSAFYRAHKGIKLPRLKPIGHEVGLAGAPKIARMGEKFGGVDVPYLVLAQQKTWDADEIGHRRRVLGCQRE